MRAPISLIIPTLNAETVLPDCLAALMEGVEAGLLRELIVSDGGSTDATGAIAQAWGAQVLSGPASRGGQLRRGCGSGQGAWLLVIHADTRLSAGWAEKLRQHMAASDDAAWCHLAFDTTGLPARLTAGWANLRSRLFDLPYGDQGLLIPRALYDRVGGYADQPLMEDVALVRALRGRLTALNVTATTSAAKYRRHGWLRRGTRNLWTLARYFAGTSPDALAQSYRR